MALINENEVAMAMTTIQIKANIFSLAQETRDTIYQLLTPDIYELIGSDFEPASSSPDVDSASNNNKWDSIRSLLRTNRRLFREVSKHLRYEYEVRKSIAVRVDYGNILRSGYQSPISPRVLERFHKLEILFPFGIREAWPEENERIAVKTVQALFEKHNSTWELSKPIQWTEDAPLPLRQRPHVQRLGDVSDLLEKTIERGILQIMEGTTGILCSKVAFLFKACDDLAFRVHDESFETWKNGLGYYWAVMGVKRLLIMQ